MLDFPREFRVANFLHRVLHLDRPLQRQISIRFETLLVRRLVLEELARFVPRRLRAVFGERVAEPIAAIVADRAAATARALDALRLQYPDHAESLERRFLQQSGLRLLISRYHDLYDEGLIGRELFDDLEREHAAGRLLAAEHPPIDLGLRTEELIGDFEMFAGLGAAEERRRSHAVSVPRLLVPDEAIIRKGERATAMFLISSGVVEVMLPDKPVRLGRGEFVGEMALVDRRAAQLRRRRTRLLPGAGAERGRVPPLPARLSARQGRNRPGRRGAGSRQCRAGRGAQPRPPGPDGGAAPGSAGDEVRSARRKPIPTSGRRPTSSRRDDAPNGRP